MNCECADRFGVDYVQGFYLGRQIYSPQKLTDEQGAEIFAAKRRIRTKYKKKTRMKIRFF